MEPFCVHSCVSCFLNLNARFIGFKNVIVCKFTHLLLHCIPVYEYTFTHSVFMDSWVIYTLQVIQIACTFLHALCIHVHLFLCKIFLEAEWLVCVSSALEGNAELFSKAVILVNTTQQC